MWFTALDRAFGVRALLVPTARTSEATWRSIVEAAGWYLISKVPALAEERKRLGEMVRVTVSWGVGMREVVTGLADRRERLKRVDRDLLKRLIQLEKPVADDQVLKPGRIVITAPMQGIVMSEDEEYEANEIARELAAVFGGESKTLPSAALVKKTRVPKSRPFQDVLDHWSRTDLVVTTAAPVREEFAGKTRAPQFLSFLKEMQGIACGDVGYLYLRGDGEPQESEVYERIGMSGDHLKQVAEKGGVVLVVGAENTREEIAYAALRRKWVSVLVSDLEFARRLLLRHANTNQSRQQRVT